MDDELKRLEALEKKERNRNFIRRRRKQNESG